MLDRLFGGRYARFPKHLRGRLRLIESLENRTPSHPWRKITVAAVGGLEAVGFAPDSDFLLVASITGAGVFDCLSGAKVARDDEPIAVDTAHLRAKGIGPIAEVSVPLAGLHGGGLPAKTADGWSIERYPPSWPNDELVLCAADHTMLWSPPGSAVEITKLAGFASEVRAFGFSPTGRTLVVATSSDVTIFGRD